MNTGDIYAYFSERLDCWLACQITGFRGEAGEASTAVLWLDWMQSRPPASEDFSALKPFAKNYFSWNGELEHGYASGGMPDGFILCGNCPPLLPGDDLRAYIGWSCEDDFLTKRCWENSPQTLRDAYRNAKDRRFMLQEKDIPALLPDFKGYGDLGKFPRLTELYFSVFSPELSAYVKSNPFIGTLVLDGRQPPSLDFRGSALEAVSLNPSGVKEIYLPDTANLLALTAAPEAGLKVNAPKNGRFLHLSLRNNAKIPAGLDALRELTISHITGIDLAGAFDRHGEIESMFLQNNNLGRLANLSAISVLKKLKRFRTLNLYGFSGEEFPPPEALPALELLDMEGLPAEAAGAIKAMYKSAAKEGRVKVRLAKERKAQWLAENLDNPFMHWDGDDAIPKTCAKKALEIYKKTKASLMAAPAEAEALCKTYIGEFNKLQRKHKFIDTVFREQIDGALYGLLSQAKAAGAKLDVQTLMAACDSLREF
ncbi:MAG: hypothetical protein FWG66_02210 [Spirochaetes bacterium]|nr:hypothetical protein [Spirochaetota bacterium]